MRTRKIILGIVVSILFVLIGFVSNNVAFAKDTNSTEAYSNNTVIAKQYYSYAFQVLDILNQERTKAGLNPLVMDTKLLETAMLRAFESTVKVSHNRPNGEDCFSAITNSYWYAGENIAGGYKTPAKVMEGWMNSPGHRSNILDSNFNRVGIGCVYISEGYGFYWTQVFIGGSGTTAYKSNYSDGEKKVYIEVLNGLKKDSTGNIYYYKNGEILDSFTGFATNSDGTWYVKNGKVNHNISGLIEGNYNGKTVSGNVYKGKLQKKIALVKNYQGNLRYVGSDGFVDFHYNGIASNSSGTYKVTNGKVTYKDTGIIKMNGKSYYFVNSKLKTGPAIYKNISGNWYVNKSGIIDFTYRGIYTNSSGKWYINGGRVRFDFTGKATIGGKTYNIVGGKVK